MPIRDSYRRGSCSTAAAAAIVALALSIVSCHAGKERRIAIIPRLSSDASWLSLHVGVLEEADRRHVTVYWHGPSDERALQGQVRLLEQAINDHAYGIVVRPSTFLAENHLISDALQKNIPVVVLGAKIGLPPNPHLHYVLEDTQTAGQLVADRLATVPGKGMVAIVGLQPDIPGNRERAEAIVQALPERSPRLQLFGKSPQLAMSGASEEVTYYRLIREHPEIRAIVALNEHSASTAAAALITAGATSRVMLISYEQSLTSLLLLRSGVIDSIVVQPLREMGVESIRDVMEDSANHLVPVRRFPPVLVNAANIDTEAVQQQLLMHRTPPW